jgi:ATP-dependent Clp protease ATP-binding subunit ClpA
MWQRFSERARKTVFYAQREAQRLGEGFVSTEHLLLGILCEEDSTATRVMEKLGVSPKAVQKELLSQLPSPQQESGRDMSLTPRAKRVIDLAYDEARNLNHNYIGTEHLLLGTLKERDGLAGVVLRKMGIELDAARAAVAAETNSEYREKKAGGRIIDVDVQSRRTTFAKSVLGYATWEAEMYEGIESVEPVHFVFGLLRLPECAACRILVELGVDLDEVRNEFDVRRGHMERVSEIKVPYGDALITLLKLADEYRDQRKATGTEHLLLALLMSRELEEAKLFESAFGVTAVGFQEAMHEFYRRESGL